VSLFQNIAARTTIDAMTFALGVFEVFTYAVPGSLLFALCTYLAARMNWLHFDTINALSGPVQLTIVVVGSYLLGHLTYLGGAAIDRVVRFGYRKDARDAWQTVNADAASAGVPTIPHVNVMLLLAAIELKDKDAASTISRFRATGLMMRNVAVPMLLAALASIAEAVRGSNQAAAIGLATLLVITTIGFMIVGQRFRYWANTKTYQLACWLDLPRDTQQTTNQPASTTAA
jgi:hypothetical protein